MSFNDYIHFLRDSVVALSRYWTAAGVYHPHIKEIQKGLNHPDPFILYKASQAATLLLEDKRIYH